MKKILTIAAISIVLGACAGGSDPEFDGLVAEAEKEIKVAKGMHYLWRDTQKILDQAKKAKEDGDDAKATKLAKKALKQAQLAQKQAKDNANAKPQYN